MENTDTKYIIYTDNGKGKIGYVKEYVKFKGHGIRVYWTLNKEEALLFNSEKDTLIILNDQNNTFKLMVEAIKNPSNQILSEEEIFGVEDKSKPFFSWDDDPDYPHCDPDYIEEQERKYYNLLSTLEGNPSNYWIV
jgi:hypothetical protein